jgi:GT2 family glycosyltransferase
MTKIYQDIQIMVNPGYHGRSVSHLMKLSVHLLTWNGAKYLPYLFDSLRKQTFKDWQLVILDNASTDSTIEDLRLKIKDFPVEVKLIENKENVGFAKGHNQLSSDFRFQISDFVLLLNQDMYLAPDCLEKLVEFMDNNKEAAVVSPRLMKWDFNKIQDTRNKMQDSFTNKIDSLGLRVFRNRRVVEKYAGKDWKIIKPKMELSFRNEGEAKEVFGVSGALPMLRRSVIDEVGLFDESFVTYKEDVDLAFRLRSAGYKAYVLLDAVAYHDRTAVGLEKMSDKVAAENKKKQSDLVRYNSYRNHLIILYKNEYWQNFILDFLWIKWYEVKKFCYFLLFDRKVLGGLKEIWVMRKEIRNRKQEIRNKRRVGWREMRKWWSQ